MGAFRRAMRSRRISSAGPAWRGAARAAICAMPMLACWPVRSAPAAASQPLRQGRQSFRTSRRRSSTTRASSCSTARQDYKGPPRRFEEVERQHPYSEWARKALIMSAYAHYEAKDYDESVSAARRYVTLHPGSPDAAYAQYPDRLGLFRADPRHHPRPGPTEKAIAALEEVVRKYPDSEYARTPSARSRSRATSSPARKWKPAATT